MNSENRQRISWWYFIKRETRITWALCQSNIYSYVGTVASCFVGRCLFHHVSMSMVLLAMFQLAATTLLLAYTFDIVNTTTCVEEDKINKRHRPIPASLIIKKQSLNRWWLVWVSGPIALCILCGKWTGLYLCLYQCWIALFYVWPAYRHWFLKNTFTFGA